MMLGRKSKKITEKLEGELDAELAASTFGPLDDYNLGGWKADAGKIRMELIPPEFLTGTAQVLTFGAHKYGDRNWEAGLEWSRCYGALQRHMWAWWNGEHTDAETGMSHLWHASCCLAFLIAYEARQTGRDDRPEPRKSKALKRLEA